MSSALLIIDMQVGLFNGPDQPHDGERILANIQQLIRRAREREIPIFAVRHTGPQGSPIEVGSAFWQLLPALELNPGTDILFDKRKPNAFHGTALAEQLRAGGIDELHIVGMKTQYCIDSTCRAAADLGFKPVLVADAHTCMDTPALPARAIIEHHNATLNGAFAKVSNAADVIF
ncbi:MULTISPECIES: cysteine hydrolase family protein [Pseudomonas]|uniref:Isochorismatase family protein YecD n=1 Tax=Pseudomonas frederiksbergensis TaxID=104087 RepID=A0A6L5C4S4_9PSED|nr:MULTISPECIES: cysteine hydrolase family protein [Pseudomonas]KAF2394487.1 Isochorismatase family protein YecD [Pseudomonas frederiksbergensis]UZE14494.1 cysteine hydrolase [Pseudomonas sp. B21-053]